MKRTALAALLLAACGQPVPRPPVVGQEARAAVDAATKVYSDCVSSRAATVDVAEQLAGNVVDAIVKACKPARQLLVAKVAAFHHLGHPKERLDYAEMVAEESVKDIDEPIASAAVIKIVERQHGSSAQSAVAPAAANTN